MIQNQIVARGITDQRLLAALRKVPRERFLQESNKDFAFEDRAVGIGSGQTISQPYIVALMTYALQLKGNERVLEIGVGSGYGAAVLSHMANEYYGVEILAELLVRARKTIKELGLNNIHFRQGDGNFGWTDKAPFNAISVTAAAEQIPPPLIEQLARGGRLVIPVKIDRKTQHLIRIHKSMDGLLHEENLGAVAFVPFVGSDRWLT